MTRLDAEVAVFRLAILTEDITNEEAMALRFTAQRLEREWNHLTSGNIATRLREYGLIDLFREWASANPDGALNPSEKHVKWWIRMNRQAKEVGLTPLIASMA